MLVRKAAAALRRCGGSVRLRTTRSFCSRPVVDRTSVGFGDDASRPAPPASLCDAGSSRTQCSVDCATAAAKAKAKAATLAASPATAAATAAVAATPSASGSASADPTFYRRPLPDTCVAFSSPEGRRLFGAALHEGGLKSYFQLAEHYVTQAEPAFCGLSTLSMCLNALGVDPGVRWKGVWRWYDEEVLVCCVPIERFKETGMSFDEFSSLARCNGVGVQEWRAMDSDIGHFRRLLESVTLDDGGALADSCPFSASTAIEEGSVEFKNSPAAGEGSDESRQILVASYDRRVFGQTGEGHFSPVAAYCPSRDKVLMMDVARFKYPPHWVDVNLLWEAMSSINNWNNKSRGYFSLEKLDADMLTASMEGADGPRWREERRHTTCQQVQ